VRVSRARGRERAGVLSDETKRSLGNLRRLGPIAGDGFGVTGDDESLMLDAPESVARALLGGLTPPRPAPAPAP
jgi:hypothetical protein